jgi:Pentapeptide repeats (8 copies)
VFRPVWLGPPSRRRRFRALVGIFGWSGWQGVGSLITALAAIGALVFTAQSLRATQQQIALSEQGQLTDRFGKAIEQLGAAGPDKLDVRLGGIYALERLASDSGRDHPVIIEVLAAFVRDRAPATACPSKPVPSAHPATDVQAALTVIGRDAAHAELTQGLDLTRTCLRGANLFRANLTRATFSDADLSGANLFEANLTEAWLPDANLTKALLIRANLTNAVLGGADLTKAELGEANLTEAIVPNANLAGANFQRTNLTGAYLGEANLTGANLRDANLTGATSVPAAPSVQPSPGPTR